MSDGAGRRPQPPFAATLRSPILGTMVRRPAPVRMIVRQGDEIIADIDGNPSLGLDPTLVDADWSKDPWFLRPLPQEMEHLLTSSGFGRPERAIAARALSLLYPHSICKEMAEDEDRLAIIYGLFEPYVLTLLPLLPLGLDLDVCKPWNHERILTDLRGARSFWGAEREAWAWARLVRHRLTVEVEPPGRDNSRPDFGVSAGTERTYVEVKTNPMPDAERLLSELKMRVSSEVEGLGQGDRFVSVRGTASLGDAFLAKDPWASVRGLTAELRAGLAMAAEAVRVSNHAPGDYSAGQFAHVQIATSPDELIGMVEMDLWAGLSTEKLVARVLRKVREANQQVPRQRRGVAVVDVGGLRNLAILQDRLRFEGRARPEQFDSIACVVAVAVTSEPTSLRREIAVPMPVREAGLYSLEWKVVEALLGRSPNEPPPVAPAPPGSGESPLRPGSSLLCPLAPSKQ